MELTDSTVNILKNYATINPNIVVTEGNTLKTISVARNVLSQVTVEESFPQGFGIYDLNEFLNSLKSGIKSLLPRKSNFTNFERLTILFNLLFLIMISFGILYENTFKSKIEIMLFERFR